MLEATNIHYSISCCWYSSCKSSLLTHTDTALHALNQLTLPWVFKCSTLHPSSVPSHSLGTEDGIDISPCFSAFSRGGVKEAITKTLNFYLFFSSLEQIKGSGDVVLLHVKHKLIQLVSYAGE